MYRQGGSSMSIRFDVAARVVEEATMAQAHAAARSDAWREPVRILDATQDLLTQAAAPLGRANDLESTSFAGYRYLRSGRTDAWSNQSLEGVELLRTAEHGASAFRAARQPADDAIRSLPDSVFILSAPQDIRQLDLDDGYFLEFATVVAQRKRVSTRDMQSIGGHALAVDFLLGDARNIRAEVDDLVSLPPIPRLASAIASRAQTRVVEFGNASPRPTSTPLPRLDGLSHRQQALLDASPIAGHIMEANASVSKAWSTQSLADVVAVADETIEAAREAISPSNDRWRRIDGTRRASMYVAQAREVIASVSLVPGSSESLGPRLVELERTARNNALTIEQLDELATAFHELAPTALARTRSRISELAATDSLPSLLPAEEARIRFEALLEQTPAAALDG
jgi:hypothetical protein